MTNIKDTSQGPLVQRNFPSFDAVVWKTYINGRNGRIKWVIFPLFGKTSGLFVSAAEAAGKE